MMLDVQWKRKERNEGDLAQAAYLNKGKFLLQYVYHNYVLLL